MLVALLLGLVLGWIGSIPTAGPISALVVTRGIQGRFRAGIFIALGGGVMEAIYAFLSFWGFAAYLTDYPLVVPIARAVAAVVLGVLGIALVFRKTERPKSDVPPRDSAIGSFMLGASVCALNPTVIAGWAAVVASLYSMEAVDLAGSDAFPFAVGVAGGIAAWFMMLLGLIRRYRERFSHALLARLVRGIGVVLLACAIWFAVRFFQHLPLG